MLRPPLEIIKTSVDSRVAAGVHLVTVRNRVLFFADTTVNIAPDAGTLAEIAILTARLARDFDMEPRIAMLSFSDFGSVRNDRTEVGRRAVEIVREREPGLLIDGEMRASTALVADVFEPQLSFQSPARGGQRADLPNLEAGNIGIQAGATTG